MAARPTVDLSTPVAQTRKTSAMSTHTDTTSGPDATQPDTIQPHAIQPDTIQPSTSPQAAGRSGRHPRPRSRPPHWLLAVAAVVTAAVVAIGATVLALTVNFGNISIVGGWFPAVLFWVTIAVCAIAVVLRRDVMREFAFGIPVGLVLIGVLFAGLALTQAIPTGAPRSMYLWLCVTCLVT